MWLFGCAYIWARGAENKIIFIQFLLLHIEIDKVYYYYYSITITILFYGAISSSLLLRKVVRWKRNGIQASPNAPQDLLILDISDSLKVYSTLAGTAEPFLLDDYEPGVKHILIFEKNHNLNIL